MCGCPTLYFSLASDSCALVQVVLVTRNDKKKTLAPSTRRFVNEAKFPLLFIDTKDVDYLFIFLECAARVGAEETPIGRIGPDGREHQRL